MRRSKIRRPSSKNDYPIALQFGCSRTQSYTLSAIKVRTQALVNNEKENKIHC